MAVFYEASALRVSKNKELSFDKPCMIIYKKDKNELWISDPSRKEKNLTVKFGSKEIQINLP